MKNSSQDSVSLEITKIIESFEYIGESPKDEHLKLQQSFCNRWTEIIATKNVKHIKTYINTLNYIYDTLGKKIEQYADKHIGKVNLFGLCQQWCVPYSKVFQQTVKWTVMNNEETLRDMLTGTYDEVTRIKGNSMCFSIGLLVKLLFAAYEEKETDLIAKLKTVDGVLNTAALIAVYNYRTELALSLIEEGADVNFKGEDEMSILSRALMANNLRVTKLLIEKGADINEHGNLELKNPVAVAILQNNVEIIKLMAPKIADVSKALLFAKNFALQVRSSKNLSEMISLLSQLSKEREEEELMKEEPKSKPVVNLGASFESHSDDSSEEEEELKVTGESSD